MATPPKSVRFLLFEILCENSATRLVFRSHILVQHFLPGRFSDVLHKDDNRDNIRFR